MIFKNSKVYDILKWLGSVGLPAIGALYFELADVWNLPYVPQVVGTIAIITTFIDTVIGISSIRYKNRIDAIDESKISLLNSDDKSEDE